MDPKKNAKSDKANETGNEIEGASEAAERTLTVVAAENRRRAGRRFIKGENLVPVDALTDAQWREVQADPVLSIRPDL